MRKCLIFGMRNPLLPLKKHSKFGGAILLVDRTVVTRLIHGGFAHIKKAMQFSIGHINLQSRIDWCSLNIL